jgi:hypothetical protein
LPERIDARNATSFNTVEALVAEVRAGYAARVKHTAGDDTNGLANGVG